MNDTSSAGAEVLAKIAKFSNKYRPVAERLHKLIMESAPATQPRLWYGMPGYAKTKGGPVVLFFREDKYVSLGMTENANISVDGLLESAWFLTKLDGVTEQKVLAIINKALG